MKMAFSSAHWRQRADCLSFEIASVATREFAQIRGPDVEMGVSKIQGPNTGPKIIGLLLSGPPRYRPPMYDSSQIEGLVGRS